jgi:hypothetical protein
VLAVALAGCDITLGPKTEVRAVIVTPGLPVEIIENQKVKAHVLTEAQTEKGGEVNPFYQDVGGWIAMPPEHWQAVKREIERLRKKCGDE